MAHSYTMAARPARDSVPDPHVLGNACALGPATFAFLIRSAARRSARRRARPTPGGSRRPRRSRRAAANALAALAFAIFLQLSAGSFADAGYHFDPTHPIEAMADACGDGRAQAPLLWLGAVAVGAIVPLAAAFMGRRSGNWRLWAPVVIIAAWRAGPYARGLQPRLSVFMFYQDASPRRRSGRRGLRPARGSAVRPAPSAGSGGGEPPPGELFRVKHRQQKNGCFT